MIIGNSITTTDNITTELRYSYETSLLHEVIIGALHNAGMISDMFRNPKVTAADTFENLLCPKNGHFAKVSNMFCQQLFHEKRLFPI